LILLVRYDRVESQAMRLATTTLDADGLYSRLRPLVEAFACRTSRRTVIERRGNE